MRSTVRGGMRRKRTAKVIEEVNAGRYGRGEKRGGCCLFPVRAVWHTDFGREKQACGSALEQ